MSNCAGYCHFPPHPGRLSFERVREKKCGERHCRWYQENRTATLAKRRKSLKKAEARKAIKMKEIKQTLTNKPVNQTAARVMSSGEHFTPVIKASPGHFHSENPIPTVPYLGPREHNLIGKRFGRFTVVGFLGKPRDNGPSSWLVRCACGHYETRRTNTIKRVDNANDCCKICWKIEHLKQRDVKSQLDCKDFNGDYVANEA